MQAPAPETPVNRPFCSALILVLLAGAPLLARDAARHAPEAEDRPVRILDRSAYWRFHLVGGPARICPERMKSEAETYLKPRHLKRIRAHAIRRLKRQGKDPDTWHAMLGWKPVYVAHRLLNEVRTQDPPPDWPTPDFDASDWTRARRPFLMDVPFGADGTRGRMLNVFRGCYRTHFEVSDPERVRGLVLHVVYRGGVRAWINGKELGRGHLPEGPLRSDTPALPYPAEAYYALPDEIPPENRGKDLRPKLAARKEFMVAKETRGPFDSLRRKKGDGKDEYREMGWDYHYGGCYINRKGYERLKTLRNRVSEFPIPGRLIRKGTNLLALDLRGSHLHPLALSWGGKSYEGTANWDHAWILDLALEAERPVGPSPIRRPAGVQVWVEDMHTRVFARDFGSDPVLVRKARIVGARNGTYGAQVVVGTDRDLGPLRAQVRAFRGAGATLPASIATVSYGRPHRFWDIRALGEGKGGGMASRPGPAQIAPVILRRYYSRKELRAAGGNRERLLKELMFFDHLVRRPPARVPAGSSQVLWVSVTLPSDAAPGTYRGTLTVRGDGMEPTDVALELEVLDWRVPNPKDFATIMAIEQSPYAVARRYRTPLWSDAHFERMEPSFKLITRAGGDFLGVPVLVNTEFGNRSDSPIRITRRRDGTFAFDFTVLDRYIDLAAEHGVLPRCLCFLVSHSGGSAEKPRIKVRDEATGKDELVYVGRTLPEAERRRLWRKLAGGIYLHMKERGLHRKMYWGLTWDYVSDESLPILLREFVPGVKWVRYCHRRGPDGTYAWCATVRGGGLYLTRPTRKGWKPRSVNLVISRNYNDVWSAYGSSLPYACRVGPERALAGGGRGIGRIGADYWDSTWLDGHKTPRFMTGMPFLSLFWPGRDGADSSIRYEALLEGLQEAEARVFLEQAVERLGDDALARRVSAVLDRHFSATLLMPCLVPHPLLEEHASGWQRRSCELYRAAADVAKRVGIDLERRVIDRRLPALGRATVGLKLRNWTRDARAWKLTTGQDWIRPGRTSGTLGPRTERIPVALDARALTPGETAKGTLTLTDVASGRTEPVAVTVHVGPICTLTVPRPVANLTVGESRRYACTLLNRSADVLTWRLEPSAAWIQAAPSGGRLGPFEQTGIGLEIAPPDRTRARHEVALRLTGQNGLTKEALLVVQVLPPYVAPKGEPPGTPVPMQDFPKDFFRPRLDRRGRKRFPVQFWNPKDWRAGKYQYWPSKRTGLCIGARTEKDDHGRPVRKPVKRYERGFGCRPGEDVTCRLAGRGITAFSAEVGWLTGSRAGPTAPTLHFEVYVDGRFAAHSHLVKNGQAPRRLVVTGLENAKEIRLVTRLSTDRKTAPGRKTAIYAVWGDPTFYHKPH
jgi:hypothetical protein